MNYAGTDSKIAFENKGGREPIELRIDITEMLENFNHGDINRLLIDQGHEECTQEELHKWLLTLSSDEMEELAKKIVKDLDYSDYLCKAIESSLCWVVASAYKKAK